MDNLNDKYNEKKNPFSVPEGYFDGLTDRMMDKLKEEQRPQRVRLTQLIRPYLGLAAIFVLALLVIQLVFPLVVNKNQLIVKNDGQITQVQEEIEEDIFDSHFNPSNEEIIEYLAAEVDEYELAYADLY